MQDSQKILWILIFLLINCLPGLARISILKPKVFIDHNTGSSGSLNPTIPEPMVFDLVRPLGAEKGEMEINTLVESRPNRSGEAIRCAPEIELVVANGFALEFELPIRGYEIDEYKLGLQKTFGRDREKRFIHGWQTITKYSSETNNFNVTNLYIAGYRFNKKWSTLTMNGLKNNQIGQKGDLSYLSNVSFFRHFRPSLKLGIETNYAFNHMNMSDRYNSFLVIPQLHYELGKQYSLQMGAGIERYDTARYASVLAMRLVREF